MVKKYIIALLSLFLLIILNGCLPPPKVEIFEEIAPNETAFVVPLEGGNEEQQGKFMSVGYLEKAKVATKRVTIPQRAKKIGRYSWDIEWIPTVKVIKVDRSPVTRDWTADPHTGTANKNQSIEVESKDSIGFWTGVTVTARITEDDAAAFLYNYAGKPLAQVVDENVRGYAQAILAREFGNRNLEKCKSDKSFIFDLTFKEVKAEFAKKGVTIDVIGNSQGLNYTDAEIQKCINKAFIAENEKQVAQQEQEAQKIRNQTTKALADTKLYEAQQFGAASNAQKSMMELEITKIQAEAMKIAAEKWNGVAPTMVTPGSGFLFNLDKNMPSAPVTPEKKE
jgi:hypothetical protein